MSANLTLRFKLAEKAFRQASTPLEELRCLETMLTELPKHKGTDKMQADIKGRISRLKKQLAAAKPDGARASSRVPRQGAGRAVIIGPPNSGKSQLLGALTRAEPEIGDYPFTTRTIQPAMMPWQDVLIQVIDTPPITKDVFDANVEALIRNSDVVVLLLDLGSDEGPQDLMGLLDRVEVSKTRLAAESFVDQNEIGVTFTQTIFAPNKIDCSDSEMRLEFFNDERPLKFQTCPISALVGTGLDSLRDSIFGALDIVRIYTKLPTEKEPDMTNPYTMPRGSTLSELAPKIHQDFAGGFKNARVWGENVHDATIVKGEYILFDKDVIELKR